MIHYLSFKSLQMSIKPTVFLRQIFIVGFIYLFILVQVWYMRFKANAHRYYTLLFGKLLL